MTNYLEQTKDTIFKQDDETEDSFSVQKGTKEILESKYEKVDTEQVAEQQQHLPQRQRDQLSSILGQFTHLFSGKLGKFPNYKVHLELTEEAKPFHFRPYPVPHAHRRTFKNELQRLVDIEVLSPTGPSEYLSPTFIIPKRTTESDG